MVMRFLGAREYSMFAMWSFQLPWVHFYPQPGWRCDFAAGDGFVIRQHSRQI